MKCLISDIKELACTALIKGGISSDQAKIVTDHAIEAQMAHKSTHGVSMIPKIIDDYKKATPTKITIVKDTPVSSLLDGGQLPGVFVATTALEMAMKKAKSVGIGLVGGYNTGNIGILAVYMRQAVKKDLIGFATCNSTGTVLPYGSLSNILGTNPIGVGIPSEPLPIILDMATSCITFAEIRDAIDKGQPVRPDCVVDENGNMTTDPKQVFKGGVLPFDRSYKGYGLGLVAEVLAGPLVNAKAGWNAVKGSWGFIMIAINPEIMVDLDKFKTDVQSLISEIKKSKLAKGFSEVLIPGENSGRNMINCLTSGYVEIDDNVYNAIKSLASI